MKQVILVDFSNLIYSVHFTHQNLATLNGRPTGVIFGTLNSILSINKKYPNIPIVFCLDGKGKTWRHTLYPKYKSGRVQNSDVRRAVRQQVPPLLGILDMFGFKKISVEGVEADDVIGIAATSFQEEGYDVYVYSNDKDFYQLIGDGIKVIRKVNSKTIEVKPSLIKEEYGVDPEMWTQFRALMGDPSDNIKPLAGVGPKTAVKMLEAGIDPALKNFSSLPKKTRIKYKQLRASWYKVHVAYQLSEISRRADFKLFSNIQKELLQAKIGRIKEAPRRARVSYGDELLTNFIEVCQEYEFESLIGRRHELLAIP